MDCENDDDIISSLTCREDGGFDVEGFTVQRTLKYEWVLRLLEQGGTIAW